METREIESKNAGKFAWFAARDARMRSAVNSTIYSEQEKARAERLRMGLMMVYGGNNFYTEYRKKFITVKIEKPVVYDRKSLSLLESDYSKIGIVKRVTDQGITYRIPKI